MTSNKTLWNLLILLEVVVLAALGFLIANSFPKYYWEQRELMRNYNSWQALAIDHYRVSVEIVCFCGFSDRMPLSVEVEDSDIVSVTDNYGAELADDDEILVYHRYELTVDDLFGYAYGAMSDADRMSVEYDPQFGFPTSVRVDPIREEHDDETSVSLADFEILP